MASSLANKIVSKVMSGDSRYSITFNLKETYASSGENYSICSYELTATKSSGTGYFSNYANNPVYVEINGQVLFNQNITYNFSTSTPCTITLASGTVKIPHNNNGTKNVSFKAIFTDNSNSLGSASISDNVELFTIPRESSVGVSDTYIGATATIVINKNDDSFVHTLKYSFGNLTGRIATKISQSVYAWTIPTDFYGQIPNDKNGVGTITCQTYNRDTLVGTSTTNFKAMVDEESSKPIVSATLEDVNDTTIALTGDKNVIIKYLSNVKTVINATPRNSATIKSYKVTCGDGKSTTTATSILNAVENNQFSVSSTDSRGFTTTIEKTLTMINYIRLAFIEASITRPETTSNELNFNCRGNWFNGNFSDINSNTLSLKFRYKEKNGEYVDYQNLDITINNNTFSVNGALGTSFDYKKQYDFEFILSDKAMSLIITFNVESGQSIIRVAEHYVRISGDLKIVGGDLYIDDKNIFDYINNKIKSGENGFSYNITEKNLNDVVNNGFYYGNNLINGPVGNKYGYLLVIRHSSVNGYCKQIFIPASLNDCFIRTQNDGTWKEWTRTNQEKILWSNPYPSQTFVAQNITLSSNDYDQLLWFYKYYYADNFIDSVLSPKGYGVLLTSCSSSGAGVRRAVTRISDTNFSVAEPSGSTTATTHIIPVMVIGKKTGIFD